MRQGAGTMSTPVIAPRAFVIAAGTEEGRPPGCESGGRPGEEAAGS